MFNLKLTSNLTKANVTADLLKDKQMFEVNVLNWAPNIWSHKHLGTSYL